MWHVIGFYNCLHLFKNNNEYYILNALEMEENCGWVKEFVLSFEEFHRGAA